MPQSSPQPSGRSASRLRGAEIRRYTLKFQHPVWEKLYRRQYVRDNRLEIKAWALAAIAIFGAAGIFEYLVLPAKLPLALGIRFGLCVPWFTGTYWLAFYTRFRRYYGRMMLVSVTLAVFSSVFMYSQTAEGYRDLYLFQYLVAVLFLYLHMGIAFEVAAATGWLSCAVFFALAILNHAFVFTAQDAWRGGMIVLSNVICMFSSYNHELAMRRYFRANQLMAQQRKTERNLHQQLSVVNRQEAIGRLAGGVAHEFNNLLQVISGNAQYVLAEPGLSEGVGAHLRMINKAAGSGAALTRQLLAFSRPQPQSNIRVTVDELVGQQIKMMRRVIPSNIEVDLQLEAPEAQVFGDPGMLEQVLVNLCLNARDAMTRGGKLTVSTALEVNSAAFRQVRPWARADAYAVVTVSDTGHGIPPEVQEHIFEPFFTTKEVGKGTGLGLSIVYGILQQHEGMVELANRPGAGASFRVYLPIAKAETPAAALEASGEPVLGGAETILVVDDNPDLCVILTELLQSRGYRVLAAQDGQAGLRAYSEHRAEIRLAILDSMMPKIGGLELFKRLREENPRLPVIISSGYAGSQVEAPLAALKDVPMLRKPYQMDSLFRLIREQLDRGR